MTVRPATEYQKEQRRRFARMRIGKLEAMMTAIRLRTPPFNGLDRDASDKRRKAKASVHNAIRRWQTILRELDGPP